MSWFNGGSYEGLLVDRLGEVLSEFCFAMNEREQLFGLELTEWSAVGKAFPSAGDFDGVTQDVGVRDTVSEIQTSIFSMFPTFGFNGRLVFWTQSSGALLRSERWTGISQLLEAIGSETSGIIQPTGEPTTNTHIYTQLREIIETLVYYLAYPPKTLGDAALKEYQHAEPPPYVVHEGVTGNPTLTDWDNEYLEEGASSVSSSIGSAFFEMQKLNMPADMSFFDPVRIRNSRINSVPNSVFSMTPYPGVFTEGKLVLRGLGTVARSAVEGGDAGAQSPIMDGTIVYSAGPTLINITAPGPVGLGSPFDELSEADFVYEFGAPQDVPPITQALPGANPFDYIAVPWSYVRFRTEAFISNNQFNDDRDDEACRFGGDISGSVTFG